MFKKVHFIASRKAWTVYSEHKLTNLCLLLISKVLHSRLLGIIVSFLRFYPHILVSTFDLSPDFFIGTVSCLSKPCGCSKYI